mmetsp:Transcript_96448/g.210905  ORF Transcript_96448/g.210905 Transcript_96448/m.210905 type:complete len:248 (-) Transcript_96448:484-1227(-)
MAICVGQKQLRILRCLRQGVLEGPLEEQHIESDDFCVALGDSPSQMEPSKPERRFAHPIASPTGACVEPLLQHLPTHCSHRNPILRALVRDTTSRRRRCHADHLVARARLGLPAAPRGIHGQRQRGHQSVHVLVSGAVEEFAAGHEVHEEGIFAIGEKLVFRIEGDLLQGILLHQTVHGEFVGLANCVGREEGMSGQGWHKNFCSQLQCGCLWQVLHQSDVRLLKSMLRSFLPDLLQKGPNAVSQWP